jgi:hypothetical protein
MAELSPDEVQRVLRRAAEIEQRERPERSLAAAGQMTRADVTQIAEEVGIAPDAVRYALAELDAGVLAKAPPARGWADRVLGSADVVATRSVRGPVDQMRHVVEQYFASQLMQIKRNLGERGMIWEPAADLWSRLRRAFDLGRHLVVPAGSELETQVLVDPADPERALVRLVLRLADARERRVTQAAAGVVAGVAAGIAGVVMLHTVPLEVMSGVVGAGAAAGSVFGVRARHHRDLARAETALQRFLDMLEHGR